MSWSGVPQPRLIRPNATYAICRRIEGRRFLLRPDSALTSLFIWVLAVSAKQFGVLVHVAVCMSTHFHLVVTVPNENVSDFMHRLDLRLAKALGVLRKYVRGVMWEPGGLSIVELKTTQAVVEQIAYAIVNPVKAGLVFDAADWPGVTAKASEIGRRVLSAARPAFYFNPKKWIAEASIALTMPACLLALGVETATAMLQAEVERQQAAAQAYVKAQGWNVGGRIAAQNVSPYRAATSWRELGKLVPHIAAGRGQTEARIAALTELMQFRADHREAKARWRAGERDVVFPAGTYWMRVHHAARVAPFS
jgi:putative transposase